MGDIKPIETIYNGYRFRSRLEARWAVFFDAVGITWIYEPEGLYVNGISYLPDFYLPDCKQFFECKGIMSDKDMEKIKALVSAGYSATVGYDDGNFIACDYWGEDGDGKGIYELSTGGTSYFCRCRHCGKCWFMGATGIYTCPNCDMYDGDHHFDVLMEHYDYISPHGERCKGGFTELWDVARRARFEHGETPKFS